MSIEKNIVDDLSAEFNIPKKVITKLLAKYKDHLRSYLLEGYPIKLFGVGSLNRITREARKRVLNGIVYDCPPTHTIKFTPSVKLKKSINEG